MNAGHNPPYLIRRGAVPPPPEGEDEHIHELTAGGTVIGMLPEADYEEAVVDLSAGDVLLAFTDGVTEAHNPRGEEYGEERVKALLRKTAHLPADEISARLTAGLKAWIQDAPQYDDLTFVVMKVV